MERDNDRKNPGVDKGVDAIEAAKRAVKRMLQDKSLGRDQQRELDEIMARLDEQAKELRAQERELADRGEMVDELQARLTAYEQKFEEIKEPPLLYGHVIRLRGGDLEDNEVSVAHGNQILKVTTGMVSKADIRQGQYVWLHPKSYAIIGASERFEEGLVAKVNDILGDKLVVSLGDGFEKKIIPWDPELGDEVKIGYEVSLLPPTYEILELRPSNEIRDMFLGEKPMVTYDDVGGLEEVIERLRDVVELPYKEPELFEIAKLTAPRGVLLYGPPGCGKTLLAKAVAKENEMTFFNVSVADILSKWVGESENMIKALFRKARDSAPSIIFFDEFDALGTTRGQQDTAGVHKNIIAQILTEMDGVNTLQDVYILGATNRPDMIDPALLRPGRFDEVIEIPRPNRDAGEKIISIYLTEELPIDADLIEEKGGKAEAVAALLDGVVEELYGDDKWVEFKADPDAKQSLKAIKRQDVVSGALLESIVRTAKKNYVKRAMKHPKGSKEREREGIVLADLVEAVDEESKEHALVESSVYARRQRERNRFRDEGVEVG